MNLAQTMTYTEHLVAFAFMLQATEHLRKHPVICSLKLALSLTLVLPIPALPALLGLLTVSLYFLHHFNGPFNGGSDRMSLLILLTLTGSHLFPQHNDLFLGYLAIQLLLSYFVSGWVKIKNSEWRNGNALADVFAFSAYPVSRNLRHLSQRKTILYIGSWAVMLFEIAFPLSLVHHTALYSFLLVATIFHAANAMLFGLNRFLWIWIAAFPSIIWLQGELQIIIL